MSYDGWGNVLDFKQDRNSAVATSGGDHFTAAWTFAKANPSGGWETVRVSGMIVSPIAAPPSGVTTVTNLGSIQYDYNTGIDAAISRVSEIESTSNSNIKVQYEYMGVATPVGTKYAELGLASNKYSGTSATFDAMDRWGRTVTSRWYTLDGSGNTVGKGFDHRITYDANSNPTSSQDKLWPTLDFKYDMDGLDRLRKAHEGTVTFNSGVPQTIASPVRQENFTLDQLGNWTGFTKDLNGDGVFTGADDLNESRTHSNANELLTRTLKPGESAKTLAYDAAGNMTDDGTRLKFEYDVFGRLVRARLRTGSPGNLIAEYRYNGLGYRIATHRPSVENAQIGTAVTESDPWEYHVYDTNWREVATYRGTKTASPATDALDSWPKQILIRHNAGLSGTGSSSYIDEIALRERDGNGGLGANGADDDDGWRAASDGQLEQRQYYCQNWRHDVVLLVDAIGGSSRVTERYRYSAYGVPWAWGRADFDRNGETNDDDFNLFADGYNAVTPTDTNNYWRFDLDLNGSVDDYDFVIFAAEYAMLLAPVNGEQSRSDVGVGLGYAGYGWEYVDGGYLSRSRRYYPASGVWSTRDHLGYIDGTSLYAYVRQRPLQMTDSRGYASEDIVPGLPERERKARCNYLFERSDPLFDEIGNRQSTIERLRRGENVSWPASGGSTVKNAAKSTVQGAIEYAENIAEEKAAKELAGAYKGAGFFIDGFDTVAAACDGDGWGAIEKGSEWAVTGSLSGVGAIVGGTIGGPKGAGLGAGAGDFVGNELCDKVMRPSRHELTKILAPNATNPQVSSAIVNQGLIPQLLGEIDQLDKQLRDISQDIRDLKCTVPCGSDISAPPGYPASPTAPHTPRWP